MELCSNANSVLISYLHYAAHVSLIKNSERRFNEPTGGCDMSNLF